MINFTLNDIRKTANDATFKKGLQYYQARSIKELIPEQNLIKTIVKGSNDYHVAISFQQETGSIGTYRCNCPAFNAYSGACKHIVASLFEILYAKEKLNAELDNSSNDHIIRAFAQSMSKNHVQSSKKELTLELQLEILSTGYVYILMRIGYDKLYIVKDFSALVHAIDHHSNLTFGQKFVFTPSKYYFSELDQEIINLFKDFYDTYRFLKPSFYNAYEIQNTSRFHLPEHYLKQLLLILERKPFTLKYNQLELSNSKVEQGSSFAFQVTKDDKSLYIHCPKFKDFYPITKDYQYIYFDMRICKLDAQQKQSIQIVASNFSKTSQALSFSISSQTPFMRHVLPVLKTLGNVALDREIAESIISEPLIPNIFIDRYKNTIRGKLEFTYGDFVFGIFPKFEPAPPEGKVIIRDELLENQILQTLSDAHCTPDESLDFFSVSDEDLLYDFVHEGLPKLQSLGNVFYSEDFKQMSIRLPAQFKSSIRLNENSDMLEFSFQIDSVDSSELLNVLHALKEKKKYYRLKNGRFLEFDNPDVYMISDFLLQMNLKEKDLVKEVVQIPKYRALTMNHLLESSQVLSLETNDAYKKLLHDISDPTKMHFQMPKNIQATLRNYQKQGYRWLRTLSHYGFGGILADDMGLGKTLQAITLLKSSKLQKQSLVVAPTSLVYNWESEFQKFAPDMKVCAIHGSRKFREDIFKDLKEYQVIITSYGLLKRDLDNYMEHEFEYCLIDEAQHIKNPNSLNAKAAKQIKAKHFFALTGTPIENSLTELWSIFDFIMPGYLSTHGKFISNYEKPIVKDADKEALKKLTMLIKPFILRRLKTDVLKELPPKIETKMSIELSEKQKKIYLATLEKIKGEIKNDLNTQGYQKSQFKIITALTRLRQICCHPSLYIENYNGDSSKLELLEELVLDAIESGHRILIFSQFTSMLHLIEKVLVTNQIAYFYLDGSTDARDRQDLVNSFNEGERTVFLISLKAGGTGLNLTGADMVIHYDPWWNPAVEDQATDRAYRIGQDKPVQVLKLLTTGTIEEKIYNLQLKKKSLIDNVIQPGETLINKLSEQEILQLFE